MSGNLEDRILVLEAAFKVLATRLHENKAIDLKLVADDLTEAAHAMSSGHGPSSKQALQAFSIHCVVDGLRKRAGASGG